jgi:type II secretory pathway component PulC
MDISMNQISEKLEALMSIVLKSYIVISILIALAFAKLFWSIASLFLPHTMPEPVTKKAPEEYANYKLSSKFAPLLKQMAMQNTQSALKLRAVYNTSGAGFVIFQDGSKSVFLSLNETYNNMKLVKITLDSAELEANGAKTILNLDKKNAAKGDEKDLQTRFSISKKEYERYAKNPSLLLDEAKATPTNDGIIINSIAKNSFFENLGIKSSDVIKEINNNKINTISDLLLMFKDYEKTQIIKIDLIRNKIKKELEYEIN